MSTSGTPRDSTSPEDPGLKRYIPGPTDYSRRRIADAPPGYPMLARYMSSTDQQYIFRGFRYLQTRVALDLQDQLRALESQLFCLDETDRHDNPGILRSREEDDKRIGIRSALMAEIQKKLTEYGNLLVLSKNLASLEPPSTFNADSLQGFVEHHKPLADLEVFVLTREDLVTLGPPRDEAWLDSFVHGFLCRHSCVLFRYIFSDSVGRSELDSSTVLYSHKRIFVFKMSILIIAMLALLTGPVYPLYYWSSQIKTDSLALAKTIGLQCGCTLLLGVVLSIGTRAKKHEIFTSCAGYMAVLVVFMSQAPSDEITQAS